MGTARSRPWVVAAVAAASAALYVATRFHGVAASQPAFTGACERLRASSLAVTAQDWFCRPAPWTARASYLLATSLVWAALVLPGVILAATGRRGTAFIPLLLAPHFDFVGFFTVRWWAPVYAPTHAGWQGFANLAMLAAPTVAVIWMRREERRSWPELKPAAAFASALVFAAISAAVLLAIRHALGADLSTLGMSVTGRGGSIFAAAAIGVFGALLGPGRRWWPWSLVPVALLLSMGPTLAAIRTPDRWLIWTQFGAVVPLAVIGMFCAGWRPVSERATEMLGRRHSSTDTEHALAVPMVLPAPEQAMATEVPAPVSRLRPSVVLNALGIGLLVVSVVIFRADPVGIQISTALPTFLGVRTLAQDVRVRMDLQRAMEAMDAYRAAHGTYEGFSPATGAVADPSLAWQSMPHPDDASIPQVTMFVAMTSPRLAEIAAVSASGSAFCIGHALGGGPTYGEGIDPYGDAHLPPLIRAVRRCGSAPWTTQLVQPLTFVPTMCDGLDPNGGYLMCRMVQVLVTNISQETKPVAT